VGRNKKKLKSQVIGGSHTSGSSGFFLSVNKNKKIYNMKKQNQDPLANLQDYLNQCAADGIELQKPQEDIFQLNEELQSTYIRGLHKHIQDLYDENDSLRETILECQEEIDGKAIRIQSMGETNAKLVTQVLDLKAQLHDLLR
jgi:aspartate aminotransferase-like enzyme